MNGFRKLQERLREEGWAVEWNLPCCQSCAWAEIEADDYSKVLFNHSQDCEIDHDYEDCDACDGEGITAEDEECEVCEGEGFEKIIEKVDFEPDTSVYGFVCAPPEYQDGSTFCFDGSKKGVANLKAILPIIEECGCSIDWDGTGKTRPFISWKI